MPELLHPGFGGMFNSEMAWNLVLAKSMVKENKFTHILYVAGTMVPRWLLESKHFLKSGFIATDDPHSSKMLIDNMSLMDYYFTNEKNMHRMIPEMAYLPTAVSDASIRQSKAPRNKEDISDVCFIGSVYPNRVGPLECVIRYCIENGLKVKMVGPIQASAMTGDAFVPQDSIIHKYCTNGIVDNQDTLKIYANSKCIINMDRDVKWSPCYKEQNPHLVQADKTPYSMNPRCYEASICKQAQLYIDPRQEARDTFENNMWYADSTNENSVTAALDEIFKGDKRITKKKIANCNEIVTSSHTYKHRCAKLLEYLIKM